LDGAGSLYFWGQKDTPIVLLQLKAGEFNVKFFFSDFWFEFFFVLIFF